jgi:hypothetical protein
LTGRGAVQINEPWMSGEYGEFCSQMLHPLCDRAVRPDRNWDCDP